MKERRKKKINVAEGHIITMDRCHLRRTPRLFASAARSCLRHGFPFLSHRHRRRHNLRLDRLRLGRLILHICARVPRSLGPCSLGPCSLGFRNLRAWTLRALHPGARPSQSLHPQGPQPRGPRRSVPLRRTLPLPGNIIRAN